MLRRQPSSPHPRVSGIRLQRFVWGFAAILLFIFQFRVLRHWSDLPKSTKGTQTTQEDPISGGTFGSGQVQQILQDSFQRQEQKLADIAADLTSSLRERESVLVSIGSRLQEREKELSEWQKKIASAVERENFLRNGSSNFEALNATSLPGILPGKDSLLSLPLIAEAPEKCNRIQDGASGVRVNWRPTPGKYLFVMCTGGQLSNRMACLRQHMLDAALLNRTLIFPSRGVDFDYDVLLDLEEPKHCFGNQSFLTLNEYFAAKNSTKARKSLKVDRFICHVHTYQRTDVCRRLQAKFRSLGVTFAATEIPSFRTPGPFFKYSSRDFLKQFAFPDDVIAFGNMFGVGGRDLRFQGSGPLNSTDSCRSYLIPGKAIIQTASGFVNTFLGSNYMGIHLRRGDFFQHCMKGSVLGRRSGHACFFPIQQVALCISQRLQESPGTAVVFLATNGNTREVEMLGQLLTGLQGKPVPLMRLPGDEDQWADATWAEPLTKLGLQKDPVVLAMVEKTVCVFAKVFFGTAGSTFSADIGRLRDWWRLKTCRDGSICGNMLPDVVPFSLRQ